MTFLKSIFSHKNGYDPSELKELLINQDL
jgi:hypothetical protein